MNSSLVSSRARKWEEAGHYLTIDGRSVYVQTRGRGPTMFLLHGFPTSSYDWGPVMDRLQERWRLVTFDFWGYGLTDKPIAFSYSLFDQADLVESVARQLGIAESVIVSHDMGTSVHNELLARNLDDRLSFEPTQSIFLNGSMLMWMAHITPYQELLSSNNTILQAIDVTKGPFEATYISALKSLMAIPESMTEEDAEAILELLRRNDGHLRIPAIACYYRERYIHADRWLGAIERTEHPVSFLWGDSDPIAHRAMGQEHVRRAPRARLLELKNLGHFLMVESPDRVAEGIEELLKGIDR